MRRMVQEHFEMNERMVAKLLAELPESEAPLVNGIQIKVNNDLPDNIAEFHPATTYKGHPYIAMGAEYRLGNTVYMNPRDPRLA